jgi:hypothetical protein
LEQTKRFVPHYHLLIWLPRGISLPKPDKRGWWPHGLTRIEWARNAVGYLVKYASKAEKASAFPKGARLFGVRGLAEDADRHRHYMRAFWLKERVSLGDRVQRLKDGWYLNVTTGELLRSPYELKSHCPYWSWVVIGPRAEPEAGTPLSTSGQHNL